MDREVIRDKIRGMICALMIADALGAQVELRSCKDNVYRGKLEHQIRRYNRFTKTETFTPVGAVSDDSEMTICLTRSILDKGRYDKEYSILKYLEWGASGCKSMGTNTRKLLSSSTVGKPVTLTRGYYPRIKKMIEEESKPGAKVCKSNGSLMRASPICLLRNWESVAREDARVTNPNRVNEEANIIYVSILRSILKGKKYILDIMYDMIDDNEICDEVKNCILSTKDRDISGKDKGYVLHALWIAIECAEWKNPIYSEVVDWIINKKGDTDTNAAIGCAIIGARIGYIKMMEEEITKSNYDIMINSDYFKSRPKQYTPHDLDDLVDQATDLFLDSIR